MAVKLSDIARLAGVSVAAVSYALNDRAKQYGISEATAKRIKRIAREQGYVPNRTAAFLRKGRYHLLTLIAPHFMDFFATIVEGIEAAAERHDYHVLFCSTFSRLEREEKYLKSLIARRVDGVVIMPTDVTAKHLRYLAQNKVPTVLFRHRGSSDLPHKFMSFDDVQGARLAASHLIARGCERIAFCSLKGYRNFEYIAPIHETRVRGYRQALEEAGRTFDEDDTVYADGSNESDTELVEYLRMRRIDGVIGISDEVILPVARSLRGAGVRVPEDMCVLGFSDSLAARFCDPPLTTMSTPRYEMGVAMVDALMKMIESGEQETDEVLLPFGLVERGSTAP